MDGWRDGWTDGRMDEGADRRTDARMDQRVFYVRAFPAYIHSQKHTQVKQHIPLIIVRRESMFFGQYINA